MSIYLARHLTNDEYNALLAEVVLEHTGARPEILDIPDVYEALASHFESVMMARHLTCRAA